MSFNRLALGYRWVVRWLPLEKAERSARLPASAATGGAKRKGNRRVAAETLWGENTRLVDSDAENQALDADEALQELGWTRCRSGISRRRSRCGIRTRPRSPKP